MYPVDDDHHDDSCGDDHDDCDDYDDDDHRDDSYGDDDDCDDDDAHILPLQAGLLQPFKECCPPPGRNRN